MSQPFYPGSAWLLGGLALLAGCTLAGGQDLPGPQGGLQTQQAEPALSEADREVMQRASQQIAAMLPDPGLKVGDRAPEFALPNAQGQTVLLTDLLRKGPVILTFYRGAWCPDCNLQLKQLHESLPQFQQYGSQLVAVTPQRPDKSLEQINKAGYPFEILSDLDNEVMRDYKLFYEVPSPLSDVYKRNFGVDLAEYNGPGRYVLPLPGTYVIDTRGIIRAAFADTDHRKRIEPAAILETLKTMPAMRIQRP